MRRIQNLKPYAIDSPTALAPGAIGEVEDSPDVDRAIEAGIIGEVEEAKHHKQNAAKAEDK